MMTAMQILASAFGVAYVIIVLLGFWMELIDGDSGDEAERQQ